ncbi:MAG: SDR family oxidoreductase [Rhodothermales bacterium]
MTESAPLAVITGASGRLGSVAVEGFLQAGYRVVGLDRSSGAQDATPVLAVDATSEDSVTWVLEEIRTSYGTPSVIIHTVGMWAMQPFAETELDAWQTMMDVNLTSSFLIFREGVRMMKETGGTLIGICSQQGSVRGTAQQAAYSASKAGVKRLVEAIGAEYAGTGLTAHAVAPSMILFDGDEGKGVTANDLVEHFLHLASPAGASLNGDTLHAFGD